MTRKLFSIGFILLLTIVINSCSLFQSDEEAVSIDEIDGQSMQVEDEEGDFSDEDLDKEALADEELSENEDEGGFEDGDDDFEDDEDDEELANDELGDDEVEGLEEDLADEGFEDDLEDDLVSAELEGDEEEKASEEFIVDAEPMEEESILAEEDIAAGVTESSDIADPLLENSVTNLEYKSFDNGGTVVIETKGPAQYQVREEADLNQIVIEVDNVKLPERFKRPYITKDFKQDVATINAYQGSNGSTARFVIQLKRPVKPFVQQEGNTILVMTSEPRIEDSSMTVSASEAEGPTYAQSIGEPQAEVESSGMETSSGNVLSLPENSNTLGAVKYTGEKMSLEVAGVDVRDVIQTISEKSGVNLIMDQDVKGPVNLRLRNVPWDQALVVVLKSQGLGYVRQGNVLRISKQSTLSSEAQAISLQIESEKKAKLLAGGIKVKYLPVSYAKVEDLVKKLKDFTSKEGKITHDARTSSLVVTDYEEFISRITTLVKALDTAPMQVEIEAKLVEAREEFVREAGINWGLLGAPIGIGEQSATFNTGSQPFTEQSTARGFSLDLSVGTFNIFGDLTASLGLFERESKIKVLSAPKIQTMNKTKAKIQQVTQIPIKKIVNSNGTITESIEFKDLVLLLEVTPQITFKGDVILDVKLKREFAGASVEQGDREINTREAETTVMVKNGQTAVIGGIYQSDVTTGNRGVPWIKDIPILGWFFKQKSKDRRKNELLLFLKPKIMKSLESVVAKFSDGEPADVEELSIDSGDEFEDDDFEEDDSEVEDADSEFGDLEDTADDLEGELGDTEGFE